MPLCVYIIDLQRVRLRIWLAVILLFCSGSFALCQEPYPRGPMRVSEAVRPGSQSFTRQPLRVAQFDPSVPFVPRDSLPPGTVTTPPNNFSANPNGLSPVPNGSFGQPWLGTNPNTVPQTGLPQGFVDPRSVDPRLVDPRLIDPRLIDPSAFPPNPNFQNTPSNVLPPAPNPLGIPNSGVPNFDAPNFGTPNLGAPNLGAPNLAAPNLGVQQPNQNNVFGTADLLRTPYDEVSPFGRQPLSPYAQTDFNDEVVDADLVIGLTPNPRSLNYGMGVGFNSDLGVFGQFVYDDKDFDLTAFPWRNPPVPFRGGGQRFRVEAMPGNEAQRYLVSLTEPFFMQFAGQPVSLNVSGFYFDRDFFDWDERRFGGRVGLSYALSSRLLFSTKFRAENVDLSNPRVLVPELAQALGDSELYGASASLAYDTRDNAYAPTEGGYLSASFEQVFGTFDYPRGTVNWKGYTTLLQRPDRSGRHVLGLHFDGGITGSQTPIFENFFAGGFSTLRGFRFRRASPQDQGVVIGGELSLLGSAEYFFPITADDMVRGALFTDLGSVSETTSIDDDDFRLSVGAGLRLSIPALGPAPLAVDFAVPLIRGDDDRVQNLAFFISVGR